MSEVKKAPKLMYSTACPYTITKILKLPQPQHDITADLLVSTLSPIAAHRENVPKQLRPRSKKRHRKAAQQQAKPQAINPTAKTKKSTPPDIQQHVLVGFNSVTRRLEDLSRQSRKSHLDDRGDATNIMPHLAAVFLFRPMDDLIYSHLPALCYTSSLAYPEMSPTRLILLDPTVETKVRAALSQSHGISLLAIQESVDNASGAQALIHYIRGNVKAVEVPWLQQVADAQWLGTNIDVQ